MIARARGPKEKCRKRTRRKPRDASQILVRNFLKKSDGFRGSNPPIRQWTVFQGRKQLDGAKKKSHYGDNDCQYENPRALGTPATQDETQCCCDNASHDHHMNAAGE